MAELGDSDDGVERFEFFDVSVVLAAYPPQKLIPNLYFESDGYDDRVLLLFE